jgi:geranylgeranyl diphosphate synthase, type I
MAMSSLLARLDDLHEVETLMKKLVYADGQGGLGAMMGEHLSNGGKRIRARLTLAAASALHGSRMNTVGWAAACELLHNATLIHDDIQDQDEFRRGRPTLWAKYGIVDAINAGDFMFMLPFSAIQEIPDAENSKLKWELGLALARGAQNIVKGQSAELRLIDNVDRAQAESEYMLCASLKTATLFSLPIFGAALISGLDQTLASELASEFDPLGVLFQMQDDVLDLYGDKGRDKAGQDLQEGMISFLVVEHLRLYPEDREWLLEKLCRPRGQLSDTEVREIIEAFRDGGALQQTFDRMEMLIQRMRESKLLAKFPGLYFLAVEATDLILEPIQAALGERLQFKLT